MPHRPSPPQAEQLRKKSPEEVLREATNAAAVSVVAAGFDAIDQLGEMAKDRLKKALIRGISGKS